MSTEKKTCPKCERPGYVGEHFGFRTINGQQRPQSYCRECRNKKAPKPTDVLAKFTQTISFPVVTDAKPAYAVPGYADSDILEVETTFTKCDGGCDRRFTRDPVAAGWHECHYDEYSWKCEECWRKQFDCGWIDYTTTGCVVRLGSDDDRLRRKFTRAQVLKRIQEIKKTNPKSKELKFWSGPAHDHLRWIGCKDSSRSLGLSLRGEDTEVIREIVGWKEFPPLPETVRIK